MAQSWWQRLLNWFRKSPEPASPAPLPTLPKTRRPFPEDETAEDAPEPDDPTKAGTANEEEIRHIIAQIVSQDLEYESKLTSETGARREAVLEAVVTHFKLPSLAAIANSLQQSISDEDFDLNDVVEKIEADASLGAQVLKMANSAFMRGATEVTSLHEAALQMGSRTLKQLVFSLRIINTANQLAPDFDWTHLWKHNFAVSVIAVDLQTIFGIESRLTSGIGLIHDLGKVILSDLYPAEYAGIVQAAYEHSSAMGEEEVKVLGISHEEVGAQYFVHNQFSPEIQEALLYQNNPAAAPNFATSASLLQLANYFAKLHGLGYSGDRSYLHHTYDELVGWKVLLDQAGADQREMIERYEGYLRSSLRASLAKARHQVDSMFAG